MSRARPRLRPLPLALGGLAALPLLAAAALRAAPAVPPVPAGEAAFFEQRVRPVLVEQCYNCHSALAKDPAAGLRLDTREGLLKGGTRGPAVVPGDPGRSLLLKSLEHTGSLRMPPARKLPASQIAALAAWVKQGAPWPETAAKPPAAAHWAFQPVKRPAVPVVKDRAWVKTPIDAFVLAELEKQGLRPSPPADRRTLVRRATFDLTGLPPTPEEVDAFLNDRSPGAWEKVVDRLLASPRYGERWGRHWLDVARYGDSNGLDENLTFAHAWRYRDYVIDAFNRDLPFDAFLREQVAGDLLPPSAPPEENLRRLVATGFLSLGAKMLAEDDPVKMEMDIIDEQVDTLSRAFMGMTMGCARCHDHKYDPLSMADYYGLAGIFKSTKTMENFRVVAVWHENELGTPEERRKLEEGKAAVAARRREADERRQAAVESLLEAERARAGEYLAAGTALLRQREIELRSVSREPGGLAAPGVQVVEAEAFQRGNLVKDFTTYGNPIGVLVNAGQYPNFAEYEVTVPTAGPYQVELRYAAAESRPVRLILNGETVRGDAAREVTGSWTPESQAWFVEGIFALKAGKNLVRLERPDAPFPHVDKLLLAPRVLPPGVEAVRTAEQLAAERGLNPEVLRRWTDTLARTRGDGASPLAAWHRAAGTAAPGVPAGPSPFEGDAPAALPELARRYGQSFEAARQAWKAARTGMPVPSRLEDPRLEPFRAVLYDPQGPYAAPPQPERFFPEETTAALKRLADEAQRLEAALPALPVALGVREGTPSDLRIHIRGSHLNLGDPAPRRFPAVMAGPAAPAVPPDGSGRLQLADWMASPAHPLTGRVIVNRVWQWHFGEGIVRSPDNFGTLGEKPTHPALLDWLASVFTAPDSAGQAPGTEGLGWSLKRLHRMILLSSVYRQSSSTAHSPQSPGARARAMDPENRLLWRFNRRRLEAEAIRDSLLAVSGSLDLTMGGTLLPLKNREYVTSTANRDTTDYNSPRRAVYLPVVRSSLYDFFTAFDFGDPSVLQGRRDSTTVAPQALFMMNGGLMLRESRRMAERLLADAALNDAGRIRGAFMRAYGRAPRPEESARLLEFVRRVEASLADRVADAAERRLRAWQSACRVVLAASEFIYVD